MVDYSRHYAALGVTSITDWPTLRARYKRLIGQWHPDRFPASTSEKAVAEERSKQITIAYHALERYYRGHGTLPPLEAEPIVNATESTAANASAPPESASEADQAVAEEAPAKEAAVAVRTRPRVIVAAFALVLGAYFVHRLAEDQASEGRGAAAGANSVEAPNTAPPESEASRSPGGITVGSTLGEVYAIQGVPTLTQGDTWYYGKSSIRFEQGKAVSWTQDPDYPLRIARDQPVERVAGVFHIGSTKDEVRSIQGIPVAETETVWDYGPSRVYFEHNRVVRWETSPLQPLHVPR